MEKLEMRNLLALVMAGGAGERLYPLTRDRAKPAVPFGGIYRIIDFTLSNCVNSGVRKIGILTQYKSFSLERHIRQGWSFFSSELGEYIFTIPPQQRISGDWYRGTADAVYQNFYFIDVEHPSDLLILSGDHIYKMNYGELFAFHKKKDADATVSITEIESAEASRFGIVEVDKKGNVSRFYEKPQLSDTALTKTKRLYANMGVYIFKTKQLKAFLEEDNLKPDSTHDFGRDIIPSMIGKAKVLAYNFRDENRKEAKYWRDIGTIDSYWEANMDLVGVDPIFNLYDQNWPIGTYHKQLPPAKTVFAQEYPGGRIGLVLDSLISHGCIVSGGRVQNSILSPRVRINSFSQVYESILFENVHVGRYAKIRKTIIDRDVEVPLNMEIGYDLDEDRKRFFVTDSGIVVIYRGQNLQ